MGRIPNLKRIVLEEFPSEHRKWLVNLIDPLNDFLKIMYQNFNNGITFADNMVCQIKELTFDKTASYPTVNNPLKYQNTMKYKPVGVVLLSIAEAENNPQPITNAVSIDWTYLDNEVKINNIAGLTNGTKYTIKLLSIGG